MKKSLIALAVLAAASGAAMAQSSVTLFGVVDATVRYNDNDVAAKWQLTNSGYNSSRIGFRGTEDLGGGLNASFWLEAGVNNDNGTGSGSSTNNQILGTNAGAAGSQGLTFNRRSTVSLAGTWGELRLGRDYVPFFWNMTVFDPFGTNGVGSYSNFSLAGLGALSGGALNTTAAGVRASNSIGYFMPNMSGFYGQAMLAMGEEIDNTPNKSNGNVGSFRVGYANGPFDVALGWGQTTFAPSKQYEVTNVGASWNFGVAKIMGVYNKEEGDNKSADSFLIGGSMPIGAGEIKASYVWGSSTGDELDGDMFAIGYVYNLSKRTALYTTYSYINNSGTKFSYNNGLATGVGASTWGLDFGVKHSF